MYIYIVQYMCMYVTMKDIFLFGSKLCFIFMCRIIMIMIMFSGCGLIGECVDSCVHCHSLLNARECVDSCVHCLSLLNAGECVDSCVHCHSLLNTGSVP